MYDDQGEGIMNYPVGEPTIGDPMEGARIKDGDVADYLRSIGALGDPRGEPVVLYPEDFERLEKRLKILEDQVAKNQAALDELNKKKRKKKQ